MGWLNYKKLQNHYFSDFYDPDITIVRGKNVKKKPVCLKTEKKIKYENEKKKKSS